MSDSLADPTNDRDPVAHELRTVAAFRRRALARNNGEEAAHTAEIALLDAACRRALELLHAVEAPHAPD